MPINVMVELAGQSDLAAAASAVTMAAVAATGTAPPDTAAILNDLPGFTLDAGFAPVPVPRPTPVVAASFSAGLFSADGPADAPDDAPVSRYLVRGALEEDAVEDLLDQPGVRAVHSDPRIAPFALCASAGPLGTDKDVARLLGVEALAAAGMDGQGVYVAIVDTGINLAHLQARGKNPRTDAANSWVSDGSTQTPFNAPLHIPEVRHGTMCAYDALIAAPQATLLDFAILMQSPSLPGDSPIGGLLSDAVTAYTRMLGILRRARDRGEAVSLVINNSWGVYDPKWDFPPGHPANYTHNPNHAFNRIVATLERFGADILFAAGNCGPECPDGRCNWGSGAPSIVGANSHPAVLCVAGVDVTGEQVGYSSVGPGVLRDAKPDISGFTHFRGSGVFPVDSGTSAACPVVAGIVAAVRSRLPSTGDGGSHSPAALRTLLRETALDRGVPGFDERYGWGIVSGPRLAQAVPTIQDADPVTVAAISSLEAELRSSQPPASSAPSPERQVVSRTAADSSMQVPGVKTVVARVVTSEPTAVAFVSTDVEPLGRHLEGSPTDEAKFKTAPEGKLSWAADLQTSGSRSYQVSLTKEGLPVGSNTGDANGFPRLSDSVDGEFPG